ncbi:MAG: transcription-repair coupling factor [Candidatus Kapabacteria bacterium]|nr:transcription-repair coupling factor [Candidatus Kapabacteria bacterium]
MKKNIKNFKELLSDKLRFEKIVKDLELKFYDFTNLKVSTLNSFKIKGLSGSLKSFLLSHFWKETKYNFIIITDSVEEADNRYYDLVSLIDDDYLIRLFEKKFDVFSNPHLPLNETLILDSVFKINNIRISDKPNKDEKLRKQNYIAVALPNILNAKFPNLDVLKDYHKVLRKGDEVNQEEFTSDLALNGFERVEFVSQQGEFSVRGGIVDFYPMGWDNPLRVEFYGDEIETIREFNTISQRSIHFFDKVEFNSKFISQNDGGKDNWLSFSEFFDNDMVLIIINPQEIKSLNDNFEIPEKFFTIEINPRSKADLEFKSFEQPKFGDKIKNLAMELKRLSFFDCDIFIATDSINGMERLQEIVFNELEVNEQSKSDLDELSNEIKPFKTIQKLSESLDDGIRTKEKINWIVESLSEGFLVENPEIAFITEHQIFNRKRLIDRKTTKSQYKGLSLTELRGLRQGDYIVHIDKGIGIFDGFEKVKVGNGMMDAVKILYAEGDILYVNLNYLSKVQKYRAQEGVEPKINRLGSTEWLRKKQRTKDKIKQAARELIKLYAERKKQKGFAFSQDSLWQKEFESSFIYEDTPDQAKATKEVKIDMESENPMDRLVCGDVGFGKTEVAIRACFKAVENGKQVAVLVPTTILAQQHYLTFKDRLINYPINVEVLSRFRTSSEQQKIIDDVKKGKIDILIGTHRILSKDIEFKDLGLLVIDEEHRFGVSAKEKLKALKINVDTLTLTATPIPRTLNMSLMGARDLSIMETPPRNRLPILTEVIEWDDKLIQKAIEFELSRNGQIFFVNDRINNLENYLRRLQMLMPKVRFGLAHGQMKSNELEKVMEKFLSRKFDVLLTTKIIESGLDIPSVNTIIINAADKFGLAELYQLRGRVGRSNEQAYCYLVVESFSKLTKNSLKRLQSLEEFTELGSGLHLAMRDMEIRGTGNLLGYEQSGFIYDIGIELYHKLLDEAISELKIEEFRDVFNLKSASKEYLKNPDLVIELEKNGLIPEYYMNVESERFYYYKKLFNVQSNEEIDSIKKEITDKYGKLPQEVNELLFGVRLKMLANNTGIQKVHLKNGHLILDLPSYDHQEFYENVEPIIYEFLLEYDNGKIIENHTFKKVIFSINSKEDSVEILWKLKKMIQILEEHSF